MKYLRLILDTVPLAAVLVLISCATHKSQNNIQAPTMDYSVPVNCLTRPVVLKGCKDIQHCKGSAVAFDSNCAEITTSISK